MNRPPNQNINPYSPQQRQRPPAPHRQAPQRPPQRRKKNALPFEKKKFDVAEWFYEHRVGICMTVIVYLIFGIIFVSARIVVARESYTNVMFIDMNEFEEQPKPELTEEQKRILEEDYSQALNRISDANARQAGDNTQMTQQDSRIEAEQQAIAERLNAGREAYQRGLTDEQAILNSANNPQQQSRTENQKTETVNVKGNVLIEFDLPGRSPVYLHMPAYQCEGGGKVVVAITVNRNGQITAANTVKSSSISDNCLTEMAVSAARRSQFNTSQSAPERQQGTISYLFVPQ